MGRPPTRLPPRPWRRAAAIDWPPRSPAKISSSCRWTRGAICRHGAECRHGSVEVTRLGPMLMLGGGSGSASGSAPPEARGPRSSESIAPCWRTTSGCGMCAAVLLVRIRLDVHSRAHTVRCVAGSSWISAAAYAPRRCAYSSPSGERPGLPPSCRGGGASSGQSTAGGEGGVRVAAAVPSCPRCRCSRRVARGRWCASTAGGPRGTARCACAGNRASGGSRCRGSS